MIEQAHRPPLATIARQRWDLLVIGGGITGAGVFAEAGRLGLRTLLVERHDFASGTSSHSAKLIHGGLHYFARGRVGLALEAVRQRERLLQESGGLIDQLEFILPLRDDRPFHNAMTAAGLGIYEAFGGRLHRPRHLRGDALCGAAPGLDAHYDDALRYTDAQTDDARLVLCALAEGRRAGGTARNYTAITSFTRDHNGGVTGAWLHDSVSGETAAVTASRVINAAGPWSDELRAYAGRCPRQRLVRGSHILFPHARLPIATAMAVYHPETRLPLYLVPWRGTTLVGTTHIDVGAWVTDLPRASADEIAYLLRGAQAFFPRLGLTTGDLRATFAGLRPIVDTHSADPARASRDYGIWEEAGLITVTGGKLTTYRVMAREVMKRVAPRSRALPSVDGNGNGHDHPGPGLGDDRRRRLQAMYGKTGSFAIMAMPADEQLPLAGEVTAAELRWCARAEDVQHLDDLLFRRVRLGLIERGGGSTLLPAIEPIVRAELGWDAARWSSEVASYCRLWRQCYAVPASLASGPVSVESDAVLASALA